YRCGKRENIPINGRRLSCKEIGNNQLSVKILFGGTIFHLNFSQGDRETHRSRFIALKQGKTE
ncbi:MAG: hypothetical protein AAGA60_24810, partial [Cyanobacteria bacterium P01_E01_bin.42]